MLKGLITIVVPAYNHEEFIEECIDSIINQTHRKIELIIINDGSKDRTAEIIKSKSTECEKRFERYLFLDDEHEGVAKSLNKACFLANGEFISLCASDDSYETDSIETMYRFLKKNSEYVLVVGINNFIDHKNKQCFFNKEGEIIYEEEKAEYLSFSDFLNKNRKDIDFDSDQFGKYSSLLKGNYIPNGYMFRTKIFFDKVKGFYEGEVLEDLFMHLQLSKYGKFKYINNHIFNYRLHNKNLSLQRDKMMKLTDNTFQVEKKYDFNFKLKNRLKIPMFFEKRISMNNEYLIFTCKLFGLKIFKFKKLLFSKRRCRFYKIFKK